MSVIPNRASAARPKGLMWAAAGVSIVAVTLAMLSGAGLSSSPGRFALSASSCATYDMTTGSVQGFVTAAEDAHTQGSCVALAPGLALSVSSALVVSKPATLNFNGATLTETGSIPWLLTATAPVTVYGFTFHGDASGGGFYCQATTCKVTSGNVAGMTIGMKVDSWRSLTAGSMTVAGSTADGNREGIIARSSAVLNITGTSADNNRGAGFDLGVAGPGSSISGSASDDNVGLFVTGGWGLTIGTFTATADNHYGVDIANSSAGTASSITAIDTGMAVGGFAQNSGGAGVELNPVTGWTFGSLSTTGQLGYGVAMARSSGNTFDQIAVDRGSTPGPNNPGLNLDQATADNHFLNVSVAGQSVGVLIGGSGAKTSGGRTGNTGNVFDVVTLVHDTYAGISIPGGNANIFTTVNATDVSSGYPAPDRAQVRLYGPDCFNNTIGNYTSMIDTAFSGKEAYYVVYADALASDNSVNLSLAQAGSYKVAAFDDVQAANTFTAGVTHALAFPSSPPSLHAPVVPVNRSFQGQGR